MINEEEKYKQLRSTLKSLPKVKAGKDFEAKLFHRIRETEAERMSGAASRKLEAYKRKSRIFNIFRPAFAPAVALTAVLFIVVILYVYYSSVYKEQIETLESEKMTEQKEFTISKPHEKVIAKQEDLERRLGEAPGTRTSTFGTQPTSTDFTVPPPSIEEDITPESEEEPVMEQKLEKGPMKLETESPRDEIKTDDMKKAEKKEAPVIRKGDKEKEVNEKNEENILGKEINKSVIEGRGLLDTSKVDTLTKKKESKLPAKIDSAKAPSEEQEIKQQDSIEK